jgi:hypothetical protein
MKLVGLILSGGTIGVRLAWNHSVVHAEFRHVCGGAGVSRSTASKDGKMVAQSRGHAQCEGSARCGAVLEDTISRREVRRCGFGEGKAGVVVGGDLAIVKVILSKVGFQRTGQSYHALVPLCSSSSRKSRTTFSDNRGRKQRLLEDSIREKRFSYKSVLAEGSLR